MSSLDLHPQQARCTLTAEQLAFIERQLTLIALHPREQGEALLSGEDFERLLTQALGGRKTGKDAHDVIGTHDDGWSCKTFNHKTTPVMHRIMRKDIELAAVRAGTDNFDALPVEEQQALLECVDITLMSEAELGAHIIALRNAKLAQSSAKFALKKSRKLLLWRDRDERTVKLWEERYDAIDPARITWRRTASGLIGEDAATGVRVFAWYPSGGQLFQSFTPPARAKSIPLPAPLSRDEYERRLLGL